MYYYRASQGRVDVAFTDRRGGVSRPPYDSLNLAIHGDDEQDRARNLALVLDDFAPGAVLADLHQVHGADVVSVVSVPVPGSSRPRADALATTRSDVVLLVRSADCVPVLLADGAAGVIGAAHAGRIGVAVGVVAATLARMRDLGAERVMAWIGPRVCGSCYEVPADMQAELVALEPTTAASTSWGTPALDLAAGVRAQLEREGVAPRNVVDVGGCTRESGDLYSHRRDGEAAGRQGALIRLRAEAGR